MACNMLAARDRATIQFTPALSELGTWSFVLEGQELLCRTRVTIVAGAGGAGGNGGASEGSVGGASEGSIGGAESVGGAAPAAWPQPLASLPDCPSASDGSFSIHVDGDHAVEVKAAYDASLLLNVTGLSVSATEGSLPDRLPRLSYQAYLEDQLRAQRTVEFDYQSSEPNGKGCGTAYSAEVQTAP